MDNNKNISVICQCLNVLHISGYRSLFHDHRSRKLFSGTAIELHVLAQLLQLKSYDLITEQLHAHASLRRAVGLDSISVAQLSRKTKALCTNSLQHLFYSLIGQIEQQTKHRTGLSQRTGRLHLIDATEIALPSLLGNWARCSSKKYGVKLHVRLVVADPDTAFPDRVIASTTNVRESQVALQFTVDPTVTYVMDRGYEKCQHFEKWITDGIRFVVRVRDRLRLHPVPGSERDVPPSQGRGEILRDVDVLTNKTTKPVRLVEFTDEKGRRYRILTSRSDLSAAEIAHIYKNRWVIELFFKWMKQHLNLVKLHSCDPDAVWNQLFLSLIAFALSLLVKLQLQTKQSQWSILKFLRTYMYDAWERFLAALHRLPTKRSKGRQKVATGSPGSGQPQRIILM